MEQRGRPLVPLVALDDLRELVGRSGPFLSVYLPLRPATEELAETTGLRWRALREGADALGVPPGLLDEVGELVEGAHREADGLCVIAGEGQPPLVEHIDGPTVEQVGWQDAPVLAPLIEARQRRQPHVVALVDREGAELAVRGDGTGDPDGISVDGSEHPLRKVAAGGWSQRRFQQRAEETWHQNMVDVAEDLIPRVDRHAARVVAIGGDERAVGHLLEILPPAIRDLVRSIEVTRAADGSSARLDDELERVVTAWLDERFSELLATHRQELGQDDRATAGIDDTMTALRQAQVATLVVPGPAQATAHGDEIDTAVAAALATGADVQVVPERLHPDGEIGAILRW
jgi:hypothetical protein